MNRYSGRPVAAAIVKPLLAAVRARYGLTRLEPVPRGDTWAIVAEVNPKTERTTGAGIAAPKRGDHIFALGVGNAIGDMHSAGAEAFEGLDLKTAPGARILLESLTEGRVLARQIPHLIVRKEGDRSAAGDAHSRIYGVSSQNAIMSVKTLAWSLSRMYNTDPTRPNPQTTTSHVAASSARAVIAIGAWLDAVIDPEAQNLLTSKSDRQVLAAGKAQVDLLRSQLLKAIRRVSGR